MPAALPPMTTRQAKRLGKKSTGQFCYSASQMRRADRREELEERRRKELEKERKKKDNKRKREEQEEKERSAKRRLLREGKIVEEDTWGKVTSSQPRLSTFFKAPATVNRSRSASERVTHKGNSDGYDSREETLVQKTVLLHPEPREQTGLEYVSDQDLLQLVSSQNNSNHPTPPDSLEQRSHSIARRESRASPQDCSAATKMSKRRRSPSPDNGSKRHPQEDFEHESFSDFEVAEDETADMVSLHYSQVDLNSPSASRSALSEMSVANVNTRAQDKPDTTSAPAEDCGLRSPPSKRAIPSESTQNVLAMMAEEQFEDEDNEMMWDKENTDPLDTPTKEKRKPKTGMKSPAKDQPESSKKAAHPGFGKFEDCEDIFDFDFETGNDDFADDEVDDATLMAMAATQNPTSDVVISVQGSPRKLSSMRDAVVSSAPLEFTPRKSMAAPPPSSVHHRQPGPSTHFQSSKLSESFGSMADEELLMIADQVEEELSQKKTGKQIEVVDQSETVIKSTKRVLPWVVNPLPPPSTQDYLFELVEEVEAELQGE